MTSANTLQHEAKKSPTLGYASVLHQSRYHDSTTILEREYEFFVTTKEPHQPEGTDRGLIRRLVMRNFFEAKGAGPQDNVSKYYSASTVMARKQLKNRFRLSEAGQETKTERRNSKAAPSTAKRKRPKTPRTLSGTTNESAPFDGGMNIINIPTTMSTDDGQPGTGKSKEKRENQRTVLKINPGAHQFDPFDVLPVPGTPQLDMLFKLYKSASKKNSIVINAKHTWWSFISSDAGLLHATLATWALYGVLVRGLNDLRVDKLRHKNEAIKAINLKIDSPGGIITDELVGTVLTVANLENLSGAYDAAQLHVAALQCMVNARGGLFVFGHNEGLIRGITWVDFHSAAVFRTIPSFPQIHLDPDTPPLPDKLLEEAACTSPTSLLRLSISGIDCFNVFYRIHRLALATSSHWINKTNRLTLSNILYESEYILLSIPDYSRTFLDFDLDTDCPRDKEFHVRQDTAHAASVVEALVAAAQIFIYAALRDLPPNTKIFSILLGRLHVALVRPSVCVIRVWKSEKNLHMLLWTFVVACSVAPQGGERSWWTRLLVDVMVEMEIKSRVDLETVLQGVAWVDTYFDEVLDELWGDVVVQGRKGATLRERLEDVGALGVRM